MHVWLLTILALSGSVIFDVDETAISGWSEQWRYIPVKYSVGDKQVYPEQAINGLKFPNTTNRKHADV